MQPDSHRRQSRLSISEPNSTDSSDADIIKPSTNTKLANMPFCSRESKVTTFKNEDGQEMETWHSIRWNHLKNMRKMVKRVVLYMALMEAIKIGPLEIVFAGQRGYPEQKAEDFGFVYWVAYMLSWVYLCVFVVFWKPLFSWWVDTSKDEEKPQEKEDKTASWMVQLNMILLPICVGINLFEHVVRAVSILIYVDNRPVNSYTLPKNTQKNWLARLMLLVGVFISTTAGYGVIQVLAEYGLAHVKCCEYMIILVPIQVNMGLGIGTLMQWKMEKRIAAKKVAAKAIEVGTIDEKQELMSV